MSASKWYCVQATRNEKRGKWNASNQVPTFYLNGNVQGIISEEHASKIALEILGPACAFCVVETTSGPTQGGASE